jgi:hypothetical protein
MLQMQQQIFTPEVGQGRRAGWKMPGVRDMGEENGVCVLLYIVFRSWRFGRGVIHRRRMRRFFLLSRVLNPVRKGQYSAILAFLF